MIRVLIVALNLYLNSGWEIDPANKFQVVYNLAICQVNYDEMSCVAFCYDAEYFGHDIEDALKPICNEVVR